MIQMNRWVSIPTQVKRKVCQSFFDICDLKPLKKTNLVVTSGILQTAVKSHVKNYPKLAGSYLDRSSSEVSCTFGFHNFMYLTITFSSLMDH